MAGMIVIALAASTSEHRWLLENVKRARATASPPSQPNAIFSTKFNFTVPESNDEADQIVDAERHRRSVPQRRATTPKFLKIEFALDSVNAGLGAGFVGIASRCSRHSNCADQRTS
jgi:hypothetical protein